MSSSFKNTLFLITARGGSKGIPGKNIKLLGAKPLIYRSIDVARELVSDSQICLSTDAPEIIEIAGLYGLKVNFQRPAELATDKSGMHEVLLHAVKYYINIGIFFENVILLQPTSPFRTPDQVKEAFDLYTPALDMVVSVNESDANPYYDLFEEDNEGCLTLSKPANFIRRQDCPRVYQYNGGIYVISVKALLNGPMHQFKKIRKYLMDAYTSVDIDKPEDWQWAEYLIEKGFVK